MDDLSVFDPGLRCRFRAAPPRRFLYPALLLLLAEQPGHGYKLAEGLATLGLERLDRASVYRALGELAADGLVRSWDEPPAAGGTRHVYGLTAEGVKVLDEWMTVVASERDTLDTVLDRYWYCNAHYFEALRDEAEARGESARPDGGRMDASPADEAGIRRRFCVAPDRSTLTVTARSSIGPIGFVTTRLRGSAEAVLRQGLVSADDPPTGSLEVDLESLASGNPLYDSELVRRFDARRFPTVRVELRTVHRLGEGNCFAAEAAVTLKGVTRPVGGQVTVTVTEKDRRSGVDRHMTVTGEQTLDLRDFSLTPPVMPLLRMYPDVRLRLHIEADETVES